MPDWDYGGAWRRHDMTGPIALPNASMVQVHDLMQPLPDFMRRADTVFVDPPCSAGNLRSFHTKADLPLTASFEQFEQALFERIDEIAPVHLFVEVFASNREAFTARIAERYAHLRTYTSMYYRRPQNRCWIIHASGQPLPDYPLEGIDEAKAIEWICQHHAYDVIGDPCMGQGLVGRHAYGAGRAFVGTELNKKRLAVLVDLIKKAQELVPEKYAKEIRKLLGAEAVSGFGDGWIEDICHKQANLGLEE